MCRFAFYLGPQITLGKLVTEPSNSIVHQSFHSHERIEPLNGDGFGVAWYAREQSPEPAVFRAITPAWNNDNLRSMARVTRSGCILAHVRAATQGFGVYQVNTHPFTHGRWSFMHNGNVAEFGKIRQSIVRDLSPEVFAGIRGMTDSEHVFALLLERLRQHPEGIDTETLATELEATIHDVVERSRHHGSSGCILLNLVVCDGERAVVSRFIEGEPEYANSLYVNHGRRYECEGGVCKMLDAGPEGHAVIVASEPLSQEPGWHRVQPNQMVLVHRDRSVQVRDMNAT